MRAFTEALILLLALVQTAHAVSPERKFVREYRNDIRRADVVFIGETHIDWTAKSRLSTVIHNLRGVRPSLNCVALEIANDFAPLVQTGWAYWALPCVENWLNLIPKLRRQGVSTHFIDGDIAPAPA